MPAGLPFEIPIDFGGWEPADGFAELEGTALAWVEDHPSDGVGLLIWQFRGKPRLEAMLRALLEVVQQAEDAAWQVLTERWLDNAIGAQLDAIGTIVDLARAGWLDDTYRALLRAQVRVLRSRGRWSDLLGILELLGVTLSLVRTSEPGMAAIRIVLGEPLDGAIDGAVLFRLLAGGTSSDSRNQRGAKAAGVRLTFEWPTSDVDMSFTLADAVPVTDAARGCGDSVAGAVGGTFASVLASTAEET